MTPTPPERNNPGSDEKPYNPHIDVTLVRELEEARETAKDFAGANEITVDARESYAPVFAIRWLAAEVRVMRLERALER